MVTGTGTKIHEDKFQSMQRLVKTKSGEKRKILKGIERKKIEREHVKDISREKHLIENLVSIDTFITVSYVEEIIFLVMLLVKCSHGSASRRNHIVDEEE